MTWHANQIYTRNQADVLEALRTDSFLADQLYLVTDFHGVHADWTRSFMVDHPPHPERQHMKHGLPADGLLVISPEIYETGYDRRTSGNQDHTLHATHQPRWPSWPPAAKWATVDAPEPVPIFYPSDIDRELYPQGLFRFLKWVAQRTGVSLMYYFCETWAGDIEAESAWVFENHNDVVYLYNDDETITKYTTTEKHAVHDEDVLQVGMRHIGLHLPTRFFALHQGSFDWKLYRLDKRST